MSIEDTIRAVVREEVRAALRDLLPAALPATAPVAPAEYLPTTEAAALAKVRPETIREWVGSGKLPGHRAGREWRVRRDELQAFLARVAECGSREVDLKQRARDILAGRQIEDG